MPDSAVSPSGRPDQGTETRGGPAVARVGYRQELGRAEVASTTRPRASRADGPRRSPLPQDADDRRPWGSSPGGVTAYPPGPSVSWSGYTSWSVRSRTSLIWAPLGNGQR